MHGIKEIKDHQSNCNENLLFLQLVYFDCVKGPTIVDKSLYPVQSWEDTEAKKLPGWVYTKGGLHIESVVVSKPTTGAP